ncbi:hypothetical protein A6U85_25345 [Agrobacterium sp. 13-626]|nr:hypothetical protein A6U85_25345 [Agrobacterium sp. 13-626]
MSGLFDIPFGAEAVVRAGPTADVRCVDHGDLAFDYTADNEVDLILNLTTAHRVVGRVDQVHSAPVPIIGTISIIPPHRTYRLNIKGRCRILALRLPRAKFAGIPPDLEKTARDLSFSPLFNIDDPALERLIFITAAAETFSEQERGLEWIAARLCVASHLISSAANKPLRGGLPPNRLHRIERKIDSDIAGPLPLSELADEAGMSPFHFARTFAMTTGWSPHKFILRRRIRRAVELFAETSMSVGEIADMLGFTHHSHLARTMRRYIGITPDMLRNRILV